MPLKPNFIERFVINNGMVPGVMIDMGLPMFQLFANLLWGGAYLWMAGYSWKRFI